MGEGFVVVDKEKGKGNAKNNFISVLKARHQNDGKEQLSNDNSFNNKTLPKDWKAQGNSVWPDLRDWKAQGNSVWPDLRGKVPHYPGGLNLQHSIEYWLTLVLLASETPGIPSGGSAVRVRNSNEADVIFVPFFSSLCYNRYSKVNPHKKRSRNKELQEKLVRYVTSQKEWKLSGGRDHVVMAHHPNSMLDAMKLWPAMFILADFGRYPPSVANVEKHVIAPYKHVSRATPMMHLTLTAAQSCCFVEVKRRNQSLDSNKSNPISLFWLSFQYAIFGIADMFTLVGLMEFFYKEAPASVNCLNFILYLFSASWYKYKAANSDSSTDPKPKPTEASDVFLLAKDEEESTVNTAKESIVKEESPDTKTDNAEEETRVENKVQAATNDGGEAPGSDEQPKDTKENGAS
ncbi:hypothetical protein Tsubulata_010360 [Turnera subulata]|uniref:Exostosin GT47 domain-containing protein n=1 Tax=Turnera subulata TaxID=218843 RepID=A0A9Q0F5Q6_9ROSI|nr:hypothetical protein Tsubulata_010360 [Turnera subulata]